MTQHLPTRALPAHPDLDHLRRQAKELMAAFRAGVPDAVAEVNALYHEAAQSEFALHDAQLVIARAYGFASWPKLKAHVDGVTVRQVVAAVRSNDSERVQQLLTVRPELARMSVDNLQVLHHAVLQRSPEMARLLMRHGANPRAGVYPHRDGTSPLTIAIERGYDEIVGILREGEQQHRGRGIGPSEGSAAEQFFSALRSGDHAAALALLAEHPSLTRVASPEGWTALHLAARTLNLSAAQWLLEQGADVNARGGNGFTPLELAAHFSDASGAEDLRRFTQLLMDRGAALSESAAVALGDVEWLRAQQELDLVVNRIEQTGGLLRIAVSHNRADLVALLLDWGFDPNERFRLVAGDEDAIVFSQGMPLWHCAATGKHALAELLLRRGADPNAEVYASGTPLQQAYGRRDQAMVELLERYGGTPDATLAGLYRQTELARRLVAANANPVDGRAGHEPFSAELLWAAACGGDPEIVRMALELVDWGREDPRWFHILEQPLRIWNHGSGHWCNPDMDRGSYLMCFQQVLARCDANLRGREQDGFQFGLTLLHSVAASRDHMTAEERAAFAKLLLAAGARLDLRDYLLKSTPLGWACRWNRPELVRLFLAHGASPVEPDAEPWATPMAWAEKTGNASVIDLLRQASTE